MFSEGAHLSQLPEGPFTAIRGISTAYAVNRLAPFSGIPPFPLQFGWEVRASSCVNERPRVGAIIGGLFSRKRAGLARDRIYSSLSKQRTGSFYWNLSRWEM